MTIFFITVNVLLEPYDPSDSYHLPLTLAPGRRDIEARDAAPSGDAENDAFDLTSRLVGMCFSSTRDVRSSTFNSTSFAASIRRVPPDFFRLMSSYN